MQLVLLVHHPAAAADDYDDNSLGSKHVDVSIATQGNSLSSPIRPCLLTFYSLPVTIRTTRFNIQKFCMVISLHLFVLCGSQKKQYIFPYTSLADRFLT
jgi:hypothetical protein